jgi:hypothetical protein
MLKVKEFLAQLDKVKTWAEQNCEPDDAVQVRLTDDAHRHHCLFGVLTELYGEGFVNGRLILDLGIDSSK